MQKNKITSFAIFNIFLNFLLIINIFVIILLNIFNEYIQWIQNNIGLSNPTKLLLCFIFILVILKLNLFTYNKKIIAEEIPIKNKLSWKLFTIFLFIFIIIKIFFILYAQINVSDDWQAIISGKNFIENGKFTFITLTDSSFGYIRGSYVSLTVALFFQVFGQTMVVAKSVPAFIGIINFILLYLISLRIYRNRITQALVLVIYTFIPYIIFNHWFIRMYVFYELFALSIILLLFNLNKSIRKNKKGVALKYMLLLVTVNLFNWMFSFDTGKYLIVILTMIGLSVILYINKKVLIDNKYIQKILANKITRSVNYIYILIIFIIGLSVKYYPIITNRLLYLLEGELANANHLSIYDLFFSKYLIFSLFFILSCTMISRFKNDNHKIITLIGLFLFILHMISSTDLQIIRGVLYFIPIFLLISLISFDIFIIKQKNTFVKISVIVIFFISLIASYPQNFIKKHPYLENELHYQDDVGLYSFIKTDLENYVIIQSTYETMPDIFFNNKTKYNLILNGHSTTKIPYFYFSQKDQIYKQISTDVPVINNETDFLKSFLDLKKNKVAIILLPHVRESFINNDMYLFIKNELPNKREFIGYEIYFN